MSLSSNEISPEWNQGSPVKDSRTRGRRPIGREEEDEGGKEGEGVGEGLFKSGMIPKGRTNKERVVIDRTAIIK